MLGWRRVKWRFEVGEVGVWRWMRWGLEVGEEV